MRGTKQKHVILVSLLLIAFACFGYLAGTHYQNLFKAFQPASAATENESLQEQLSIYKWPHAAPASDAVVNTDVIAVLTDNVQNDAEETAWNLILVNHANPIPNDYEVELTELANGQSVNTQIYPALQEMFDAARSAGVYPIVVSGYRTAHKQQSLLDEKIAEYKAAGFSNEEAINKAQAWVAVPGTSEHELGIAVDINADGIHSSGHEVYAWLEQNAYQFGFIRRYPADKTEITGIIDEPWHYRYVGIDAATEIYNQSICLEEYLDKTNYGEVI